MDILNWLRGYICKDFSETVSLLQESLKKKDQTISKLKAEIDKMEENSNECKNTIASLQEIKAKLEAENDILESEVNSLKEELEYLKEQSEVLVTPKDVKKLIDYYYGRHPEANITYHGRYFWPTKTQYSIDVKSFALEGQTNYKLIKIVKNANAFVGDIMEQEGVDFHRACDIAVMRVASSTPCMYQWEKKLYGIGEFWEFPSETYWLVNEAGKGADCDAWAFYRYCLYRIAGVPAGLLRVTVGTIQRGDGGHATDHILGSDNHWHHVNSTSSFSKTKDLLDLPIHGKDYDWIDIDPNKVWFSTNEEKSFHEFETSAAEDDYKKSNIYKLLTIKPKF
ncbi:MAG: hypothetical protein ACTSX6_00240 [Candidatus Heimdallarchaeaceae archaeon]